jgi:large subunit ribosomal protein L30
MAAGKKTASKSSDKGGKVKIKWVVSFISCTDDMRQTIRGLGLRRLQQVVERENTPETQGMIHKVRHLVEVVD